MATGNTMMNEETPSGVSAEKSDKHYKWGGDYTQFSFDINVDNFSKKFNVTDFNKLGDDVTTLGSKLLYVPIPGVSFVAEPFSNSSVNMSEMHIAVVRGRLIKLHFSSYDDTPARTLNNYLKLYRDKNYNIKISVNNTDRTVDSFEIFKDGEKMTSEVTETKPGNGGDADISITVGDSPISMNLERGGRRTKTKVKRSKRATQRRRRQRRSTRKH